MRTPLRYLPFRAERVLASQKQSELYRYPALPQSYIFQSRSTTQTQDKQEAALRTCRISIVNQTQMNSPSKDSQGSSNVVAQVVDTGASLRSSPSSGILGFSALITEGVSDLYHFSCTQMSERFCVPLWHVAP